MHTMSPFRVAVVGFVLSGFLLIAMAMPERVTDNVAAAPELLTTQGPMVIVQPYPYPYPPPQPPPPPYPYPPPAYPYPPPAYPYPQPTSMPAEPEPAKPGPERPREPAELTVALRAEPGRSAPAGSIVELLVDVTNRGRGRSNQATITIAYSGVPADVLDVRLDRAGAWVSAIEPGTVTIRSGALGSRGDSLQARIRLRLGDDAVSQSRFAARATAAWNDETRRSNRLIITVGPTDNGLAELDVTPVQVPAGSTVTFSGEAIFIPGEPLALWYDGPNGSTEIGRITADAAGSGTYTWQPGDLPAGEYNLVMQGLWSGVTAVGDVTIRAE